MVIALNKASMALGWGNQKLHYTHPEAADVPATTHACICNILTFTPDLESLEVMGKMKSHFVLLEGTETTLQLFKR